MPQTLLGTKIRHFRVVDEIGRGGMGEVYVGYDEKLERKVALKAIRAEHRLDAESKARFLREARVLSQLAHPGICQIFELVETEDCDVLVLELIEGRRLTEVLRKKPGLSLQKRLRIARELARVVVAAHQKGVIHRDLKPDNVMLTEEGQVKVLDFGMSRSQTDDDTIDLRLTPSDPPAASPEAADAAVQAPPPPSGTSLVRTHAGSIVGTLGYMSPEQARAEKVTAASDIYSLGLIFQEMFTGESPYAEGTASDFTRLLERAEKGETRPVRGLDSDLTVLIERMKSLDPALRPTAVEVEGRIDAIEEKPRRRRKRFLMAALVTILALFGAMTAVLALQKRREAEQARKEAETSQRVTAFLEEMFQLSGPSDERANSVTVREIIDRAARRIRREVDLQPPIRARLMVSLGIVYQHLGLFSVAEPMLKEALEIRERELGPDHADTATSLYGLATLYENQRRIAEAAPLARRAAQIREKILGRDHPETGRARNLLAICLMYQQNYAEAESIYQELRASRERTLGPDDYAVARVLNNIADLYARQGRNEQAEPIILRAIEIGRRSGWPRQSALFLDTLAMVRTGQGRQEEAVRLYADAVEIALKGGDTISAFTILANEAELLRKLGRTAEAGAVDARIEAIRSAITTAK